MDEKLNLLLDKIEFDKDKYSFFENSKLIKIIVSPKTASINILIDSVDYLPVDIYCYKKESQRDSYLYVLVYLIII